MIGYYVHHQGRGHLHRAMCIAKHLRTSMTVLSSLPRPADWPGAWVHLPRDDEPKAVRDVTANGRLHWAPLRHTGHRTRMAAIAGWVDAAQPELVVTDVSMEVTTFVRLMGVPVLAVGMRGDRSDRAHQLGYDTADALLLPWSTAFPEPAWPQHWLDKSWHVGAFSRFDGVPPQPSAIDRVARGRPQAVIMLGAGGTDVTRAQLAEAAAALPEWSWQVLGGLHGTWTADPWPALCSADVVITHGGNNAVAEVAAARRPAVVIPQDRPYGEQHATARALSLGGLAVVCPRWPHARAWSGHLADARALGGAAWSAWAPGDGAVRAARLIDAMAGSGAPDVTTCAPR